MTDAPSASTASALAIRKAHYGPNTSLSYASPLHIVRGEGCYLYDEAGQRYLDCVNNVAHIGHGDPQVTSAIAAQLATLNTNSRYLHTALTEYTRALLATLPPQLQVLYLTCSGSEANDLALRVARAARPGATHVAVIGGAYHGHTGDLIALSPYKFWGRGGGGKPHHVHVLPCPDPLRGAHCDGEVAARAAVAAARAAGGRICAFYHESLLSCGGQVLLPPGWLQAVYRVLQGEEGAVCVADEVQTGFGRLGGWVQDAPLSPPTQPPIIRQGRAPGGDHGTMGGSGRSRGASADRGSSGLWAFAAQGVVPDVVTMGKAMGNGYPVGGVVLTKALAAAFNNGMEYFNTYGGSTAQAVAAAEVLKAVRQRGLVDHAAMVGARLHAGLQALAVEEAERWPDGRGFIADVRGSGLFLGIEVVRRTRCCDISSSSSSSSSAGGRNSSAPLLLHAPVTATWIKERAKARRVLLSTDGPYDNVIKVKPPMCFGIAEADALLACLKCVLLQELTPAVAAALEQQEASVWVDKGYAARAAAYDANAAALGLGAPSPPPAHSAHAADGTHTDGAHHTAHTTRATAAIERVGPSTRGVGVAQSAPLLAMSASTPQLTVQAASAVQARSKL